MNTSLGLILAIVIITFFNLAVLKYKFEKERYADLALDIAAIVVLNILFGGTLTGMVIAMGVSFLISFYLFIFPPKFNF